jgi:hypothetical protein
MPLDGIRYARKSGVRRPFQFDGLPPLGSVFKHRRLGCFPLLIDEIQKVTSRTSIAQRTVVRIKIDPIEFAEISKAIGLMPGVTPTHSCDGAQLRKPEAALEPLIFVADKSVVEIDVVSDENSVAHEPHEAVGDFGKYRRTTHHLVRDARDLRYLRRNGPLWIQQGMPLVDDLVVANLHGTDFRYPIA